MYSTYILFLQLGRIRMMGRYPSLLRQSMTLHHPRYIRLDMLESNPGLPFFHISDITNNLYIDSYSYCIICFNFGLLTQSYVGKVASQHLIDRPLLQQLEHISDSHLCYQKPRFQALEV